MADPPANRFNEDFYSPPAQTGNEEEDDEEEEYDDEDDEDDEEEEEEDEVHDVAMEALTSNQSGTIIIDDEPDHYVEEEINKRRRTEGGEACSSLGIGSAEGSQEYEWNRSDIDGLFCPICMEPWTDGGEHRICCLPCGHIYGMSCIQRWLQQRKNSMMCPQCNRKCALKDVRKLYASRLVAVDEESQKKIRSLEAKCAALESKASEWRKKEADCRKREAESLLNIQVLTERITCLEQQLHVLERQSGSQHNFGSKFNEHGSCCNFELQKMFQLEGARVFDVDAANQILLVARKPRCIGGGSLITKMSLLSPHESEDITLPPATNCIRDLHISPSSSSLVLYASLGKKLAVFSMESNNIVVTYDLQAPAWSCSWDLNSSHYIYAGLQNGSVYVFDIRQTARPLKFVNGFASNPVHTVLSLGQDSSLPSGVSTILSASAIGLCQWNIGDEEGPFIVPETDNQGVCISLASCPSSDDIIISYRPKFDMSTDVPLSQPLLTPHGQGVQGSHVLFKRLDNCFQKVGSSCANVNNIRLPKSVIIDADKESRLFASEDEVTCELVLQELPSFRVVQRFKSPDHVRDVKYSPTLSHGFLGCLTEKSLQLFSTKLS